MSFCHTALPSDAGDRFSSFSKALRFIAMFALAYISVVLISACPNISRRITNGVFASNRCIALEWRRTCGLIAPLWERLGGTLWVLL